MWCLYSTSDPPSPPLTYYMMYCVVHMAMTKCVCVSVGVCMRDHICLCMHEVC